MKIEDHRDQRHRKHQTSGDTPSKLIPDRIERDLFAKPLVLDIATVKIIGKDRHKGANDQLKHDRLAPALRRSPPCRAGLSHEPSWFPALLRILHPAWCPLSSRPILRCYAAVYRSRGYRSWQAGVPLLRICGCA